MELPIEFVRRRRIFNFGNYVLLFLLVAGPVGRYTHALSSNVSFVVLMGAAIGVLAWFRWALRWVQVVQPALTLPPTAEVPYQQARRRWIRQRGIVRIGIPWGVAMAVLMNRHALMADAWPDRFFVLGVALLYWIPVGMLTGWISGRFMWRIVTPKVTTQSKSSET